MYIAVVIILLIFAIELYPLMIKKKENNETITEIPKEIENETIFSSYKEYDSFEKQFKPGKIYTKGNYNLFIIKEEEVFLVKPNKIYEIKDDFK